MNRKNLVTKLETIVSKLTTSNERLLILALDTDLMACGVQLAAVESGSQMGKNTLEAEIVRLESVIKSISTASAALGEAIVEAKLTAKNIKLFGE